MRLHVSLAVRGAGLFRLFRRLKLAIGDPWVVTAGFSAKAGQNVVIGTAGAVGSDLKGRVDQ